MLRFDICRVAVLFRRFTEVHKCIGTYLRACIRGFINMTGEPRDNKTRFYPSSVPLIERLAFALLFQPANTTSVARNMASAFTIKFKKTQGGPPNEEVEFELVDTTSGVQRRVDWQSTWGVGSFIYGTNSVEIPSSGGTSVLGGTKATSASTEYDDPAQPSNATASKMP
ncbi:hypothetical protein BKA70DRAFT_876073 [Coprinopsis sp. MPI-PUGE-AT-0042]|nr:hypothetical protein BKA70DRAFT_876073 [Coprinopsis sp. MPI-PUGE-AT-0042]